jgi:hypothetical protein
MDFLFWTTVFMRTTAVFLKMRLIMRALRGNKLYNRNLLYVIIVNGVDVNEFILGTGEL